MKNCECKCRKNEEPVIILDKVNNHIGDNEEDHSEYSCSVHIKSNEETHFSLLLISFKNLSSTKLVMFSLLILAMCLIVVSLYGAITEFGPSSIDRSLERENNPNDLVLISSLSEQNEFGKHVDDAHDNINQLDLKTLNRNQRRLRGIIIEPFQEAVSSNSYQPPALRIIILTYKRVASLKRLLESLENSHYHGDRIDVDIFIDRSLAPESLIDVGVLMTSMEFAGKWKFGKVTVHQRPYNYGLARQWLDSWQDALPDGVSLKNSPFEKAIYLEDDIEVSPHYYTWLRNAFEHYEKRKDVAGFSLQRLNFCPVHCKYLNGGPSESTVTFLSPLVGSWGYAPVAEFWAEFTLWVKDQMSQNVKPYVVNAEDFTRWYRIFEKSKRCPGPNCMWTIWHLKWVETFLDKRRYTVYTRGPDDSTLASNHMESGIHYNATNKPDFNLLRNDMRIHAILKFPKNPTILGWDGSIEKDPDPLYKILSK